MQIADALCLALIDADARFRAADPALFAKVDAIKARPGWRPFANEGMSFDYRSRECAWCGDNYPLRDSPRYCSRACRAAYRRWTHRRLACS